ncbi:hypothetical protein [Terribacillus halophilus]|uniref:hypothetical protein n=1 Tax=Terribacillus halophilus TaxID=361279 RepID=UPI0009863FBD|nr:hypothetical protein [Terribacillus halophilus]
MKIDKKLIKDIKEFDDAFPDGIYTIPTDLQKPRVKVRDLSNYCKQKGVEPKNLSRKELEQFLES